MEKKLPVGITIVGCLNVLFGFVAFMLALIAGFSSISLTIVLIVKGLVAFASGIGLLRLNYWAWMLAVIASVFSLIEFFVLYPSLAFPLELIILPYLIMRRKMFRGEESESY